MITDARAQLDALPEKWRKQADAISATMEVGCFGEATVNRKCADDLAAVLASLPAPPDEETPTNTDEEEVHLFVPRSGPDDIWCRDCEFHRESSWHRHTPLTAPPPGAVTAAERTEPALDWRILRTMLTHLAHGMRTRQHARVSVPRQWRGDNGGGFDRFSLEQVEEYVLEAERIARLVETRETLRTDLKKEQSDGSRNTTSRDSCSGERDSREISDRHDRRDGLREHAAPDRLPLRDTFAGTAERTTAPDCRVATPAGSSTTPEASSPRTGDGECGPYPSVPNGGDSGHPAAAPPSGAVPATDSLKTTREGWIQVLRSVIDTGTHLSERQANDIADHLAALPFVVSPQPDRWAEGEEAIRTVISLATMLGWENVPPRHILESEISALKSCIKDLLAARSPVLDPPQQEKDQ